MRLCNNTGDRGERNICFINASLQALNSLDSFREFFVNRDYDPGERMFPICDEIARLFRANPDIIQSAKKLRKLIGEEPGCSQYNDGSQQDASGFLMALLDLISQEIKKVTGQNSPYIEGLNSKQKISHKFISTDDGSCPNCKVPTPVKTESISILTLSTENNQDVKKIRDLLEDNFIDSDPFRRRCEECQEKDIDEMQKRLARTKKFISHFSETLIIQVARFDAQMQQLSRKVWPESFLETPDGGVYELISIINHEGSNIDSGHFYTYIEQNNESWRELNDTKTRQWEKKSIVSDSNYIYIYQKKKGSSVASESIQSSQDQPYDLNCCKECGKTFKNLKTHLSRADECKRNYDLEKLNKEIESLKRKKKTETMKRLRGNQTINEKKLIRTKDREARENARAQLPKEKKRLITKLDTTARSDARAQLPAEKNSLITKLNTTARRDARAQLPEQKKMLIAKLDTSAREDARSKLPAEKKMLIKELNKSAMRDVRAKLPAEKKLLIKKLDTSSRNDARARLPAEEKMLIKHLDTLRRKKARANLPEVKKTIIKKKDAKAHMKLWMKRLHEDPYYKKSHAVYNAEWRRRKVQRLNSTIQGRMRIFCDEVKNGPIHSCLSCKRKMFDHSVIPITPNHQADFRKTLNSICENLFEETIAMFPDAEQLSYLCFTCKNHLFKGKMPPMCHSNNLENYNFDQTPWMKLSELENSLIAKDLLFMKIVQLPKSRMSALKGQEVNIPLTDSDIKNTVSQLPRTPDEAAVIPVQLKRKQAFRNAHLKEYISPSKIKKSLETLKSLGHKHYQFDLEDGLESFEQRMEMEADQLEEDNRNFDLKEGKNSESIDDSTQPDRKQKEIDSDKIREIILEIIDSVFEEADDEDPRGLYQFDYNLHTCFQDDHPEIHVEDTTISVNPGEGKMPTSIIMDNEWDMKSHPFLDPTGQNNMNKKRKVDLTPQEWLEQRLLNEDPIWSNTSSFVFSGVNYIERKQMRERINISFQRGHKKILENGLTEYSLEDAFSVLAKISGTPTYWRTRKFDLFAKLENLGPFHWFFTLSCADYRYEENFTSLLQDHDITHIMEDGVQKSLIDGLTIEEFLSQHESKHEFIRKNTLTATRNFQNRLNKFVKTVIMNKCGPMHVSYHSWRIEFQLRGAAHCHGVLWIDMESYLAKEATDIEKMYLQPAYEKLIHDIIPNSDEEEAVVTYVDRFVTCSIQEPISRDIALEVNHHKHSFTCRKCGRDCRFDFPRYPCLHTVLAKPLRLTHEYEERQGVCEYMQSVLLPVKAVLEDAETMEKLNQIRLDEMEELYDLKLKRHKIVKIIEDPIFKKQIEKWKFPIKKQKLIGLKKKKKEKKILGAALLDNLKVMKKMFDQQIENVDLKNILRDRLLAVLKEANLKEVLKIDKSKDVDTAILDEYHQVLQISTKNFCVRLKRDISECYINNFSHEWISIWNSNMDLSPVFDFYATLCYIGEYVLKSDKGTTEFILKALKEQNSRDRVEKIKLVAKAFLTHRQMGMCEAYYRVLKNLHLVGSNIGCEFLPTGMEKSRFLRKLTDEEAEKVEGRKLIQIADREGNYVETVSLNDKYKMRPPELHNLTQIQFAKRYVSAQKLPEVKKEPTQYPCKDNLIHEDYIISRDPKLRLPLPRTLVLNGEFTAKERQFMKLRRPVVVRLHKFKKDSEPHQFYFSELELFHIFESQKEEDLCKENLDYCLAVYQANIDDINYVKKKTMPFLKLIEKGQELVKKGNIDDVGFVLDPEHEQMDEDCAVENVEHTDKFVSLDYVKDPSPPQAPTGLFKRIVLENIDALNKMARDLDVDQKFVLDLVITYIKNYKRAVINAGGFPEQLKLVIFGGAGSGKSHVIHLIAQYVEHYMRNSGDNLDHPYIVRCAMSGTASSNIDGQTLHSTFNLDFGAAFMSMGDKNKDKKREILKNMIILIVDEFSMVGSDDLYIIHIRLQEIKEVYDKPFGGII